MNAPEVFKGATIEIPDRRFAYGEERVWTVGHLRGRMVIVVWTAADNGRRVISMRKANEREQKRFAGRFETS